MSELKPCPFCGRTGLIFEDGSTHRWGVASCECCGATTGEVRRNYPDDGKWHAEAIEAWNRRALPAQAGQVPELTSTEVNDACWAFVEALPHQLPGAIFNDLKPAIYAAICKYLEQAVLAKRVPMPPEDWHIFNSGAEVASGLTWAEAWDYMTPSRIERGWTAVCVADKSNIGIVGEKGGA